MWHVGFVGGGNITDTHARAARECPDLRIAAFQGRNAEKTRRLAEAHGGRAYSELSDFLAHRPMDLVILGSPSGRHAEQGIAAVEQGLHVLVEKPIDVTTARADALVAAAEQARVGLGVIFQDRLKPDLRRLREALRGGTLGRILLASARVKWYRPPEYYAASPWRGTRALDGGAALINQGIHTVDLLLWLLGPVARVRALAATRLHAIEGEDIAVAILEMESGAVATLEATTCAWPGYPRRVEITGTEGTVTVEGDRIVATDLRHSGPELAPSGARESSGESSPTVADATAHRRVLEDFTRSLREGTLPACDGREGLRSLAVVEAVYASAGSGRAEAVATT